MRRASPSTCRLLVPESGLGGLLTPPSSNAQGPLPCAISPPACAVPGGLRFGFYTNQKERQSVCVGERKCVCECVCVCVRVFVQVRISSSCGVLIMGWQRLVGFLHFQVSFSKEPYTDMSSFTDETSFFLINSTSMRLSSLATGWRRPTERFIRSFPAKEPYNYAALERDLKDKASYGSWPPSAYL